MRDWMRTVRRRRGFDAEPARSTGPVGLPRGGVWSVRPHGREALELTCTEGELWLTYEGDPRDYVLRPGDRTWLERAGHVVVQALRASRFCLREPGAEAPAAALSRAVSRA
ncbi:DUF2917 domain-containing protein [Comamonas sp. JC664]|uniref:DUF2917 domain-containing protein n=1 Tax=Comamonas sp. JC664 TaxID=2801917 RepID=UPI0017495D1C|nr:DUF2917 domain-containing protein [Comamonas sp. JC664]MBL0698772.1 DUF2917 domain-containing protein [Comamonas sp. JC664]